VSIPRDETLQSNARPDRQEASLASSIDGA
jgi:hypothetical protein